MKAQPWLTGLAIGAGAMYLLDPRTGKRRRALARDKTVHLTHLAADAAGKTRRDLGNRARGLTHATALSLRRDDADDAVLRERVRAKMGRYVSNPSAIEVACENGCCTLSGNVLAPEADQLLAAVGRVRGVGEVVDALQRHEPGAAMPDLQGWSPRPRRQLDVLQRTWAPATRLLVALPGAALLGMAAQRRNRVALATGTVGAVALLRSLTNRPLRELVGQAPQERGLDASRSITPAAPGGAHGQGGEREEAVPLH
jgi:hypothetical protein